MTSVYTDPKCLDHYAPGHPESPERLHAAVRGLQADTGQAYRWPRVRPAAAADLELVHPARFLRQLLDLQRAGGGWADPDTFVGPSSVDAALLAAGAALQAVADVVAGRDSNALVVARPPGHHALAERSMGFCLLNSIAVAAAWAVRQPGIGRAAIIDVDVHHGNGTEAIFYHRPDVLYYSTHQYPFYPGTGRVADTGRGEGTGFTVNVPLPSGCGDVTFAQTTREILRPAMERYQPDIMLVSLGFDAHWADPLAQMRMTTAGYGALLTEINELAIQLCGGRLVLILEGGYNLDVLEEATAVAGRVLAGQGNHALPLGSPSSGPEPVSAADVLAAVRALHDLPAVEPRPTPVRSPGLTE